MRPVTVRTVRLGAAHEGAWRRLLAVQAEMAELDARRTSLEAEERELVAGLERADGRGELVLDVAEGW